MRKFPVKYFFWTCVFLLLSTVVEAQATSDTIVPSAVGELALAPFVDQQGRLVAEALEAERQRQNLLERDFGDNFIITAAEKYVADYPLVLKEESTYNRYLESLRLVDEERQELPDSLWVYDVVKELLLIPLSDSIHYLIHQEGWSAKEEPMATWLEELALHKYHIDIPVSNFQKVIKHLKKGDFGYLWHKATTSYWKEASLLAVGGLASLLLVIFLFMRWRKKRKEA